MTLKTVLVDLDESARSQHVIDEIASPQLSPESKVILCHVLTNNVDRFDAVELPHEYTQEIPYRQIEKQLQICLPTLKVDATRRRKHPHMLQQSAHQDSGF